MDNHRADKDVEENQAVELLRQECLRSSCGRTWRRTWMLQMAEVWSCDKKNGNDDHHQWTRVQDAAAIQEHVPESLLQLASVLQILHLPSRAGSGSISGRVAGGGAALDAIPRGASSRPRMGLSGKTKADVWSRTPYRAGQAAVGAAGPSGKT